MAVYAQIIIVDDDADDRDIIISAFRQLNNNITIVLLNSGTELLAYLETLDFVRFPSLIVLDYNMPGLDGEATLRALKENVFLARIPVLVYSTSVTPQMQSKLKDLNVLMCLEKGKSVEKVMEQVRFFIELVDNRYKKL